MGVLTLPDSKMGVPEAVLQKVGSLPDIGSMSKDDLAVLCKKLYEQSCSVFGEKFDVEYQVKKKDGDPQPGDGDQRAPRHLQDSQAEEGEQIQDDGGRGGGEEVNFFIHLLFKTSFIGKFMTVRGLSGPCQAQATHLTLNHLISK